MVTFMILLELAVICTILAALFLLLPGDGAREQKLMEFFLCGSLMHNAGYLLELTAPTMEVAAAAAKFENLGSTFIPLCYCWFIYGYCYVKPPKRLMNLVGGLNLAMLPAAFFNWRGLLYRHMEWLSTDYGHHYLSIDYGPLYYPFLLTRIVIPYILAFYALLRAIAARSDEKTVNRQYQTFLVISSLPVVALLAYVTKLSLVFDLSPMVLGISLSAVVILVWSRRNYDFRHMAAETVLNSMGDGVIALDDRQRLISYNRAALGIFPELSSLRIGDRVDALGHFRLETLNESGPQEFELNGRCYESHAQQIVDAGGRLQGHTILVLDVTSTKDYIDEIKRVRLQAEQANIAKSEFLANMSHEIRTPMNAIIGLSDIVMEEARGTGAFDQIKDIRSAAQSLLAIINDILDLSKVEARKMELVLSDYFIKPTVSEVVGMMDMAASQRGLVLKYSFDPSIPCGYRGDEGRIKQILINVLNNAVKFTKEGYVRISVSGRPGEGPDQELLIFEIEDTGCGIRVEDQEKIFEDFRQVDSKRNRSVEGTGLGLSIVKHLVALMGGSIRLRSVYGEGTTFTIAIPQRIVDRRTLAQAPDASPQEAERTVTFSAPGFKVLIVDDNAVNRKVAQGFLKTYGFDLSEAESGPEAIDMVRRTRFDLIFMDHMMPVMDGIEAVRILRSECGENGTSPTVIALTANAMEGVREKFLDSGFQDFIAKPLARKPLNDLLRRWVPEDRRQAPSGGASGGEALDPRTIQIDGIDAGAAAERQAGTAADYLALLELFCLDGRRKTALLRELAGQEDLKPYEVEVHGLKSASANIGAVELSDLARAQELAARSGDRAAVRDRFPGMMDRYEALLGAIEGFLERQSVTADGELLPELTSEELDRKLREALGLLEDFRSKESAEIVAELLGHRLDGGTAAALEEIREQLKMYEDDAAEDLLRRLLEEKEDRPS